MNNIFFYEKYVKYLNKSNHITTLLGGFIEYIQNPDDDESDDNNKLRGTYKSSDMNIDMKELNYGKFTIGDKKSIYFFINHILPNISFRGEVFGENAIKDISILGKGAYGFVAKYKNLVFKFNHINDRKQIINENIILKHISKPIHINIAKCYGSIYNDKIDLFDDDGEIRISDIDVTNLFNTLCIQIFEKLNGNIIANMRSQLENPQILLLLINNLIEAVNYLYSNKIIHSDINNTSNIIGIGENEENMIFKIIDFGKARMITDDDDDTSKYRIGQYELNSSKMDYYDIVILMAYDFVNFLPSPNKLIKYTEEQLKKEIQTKYFEIAMQCKNILVWCVDKTNQTSVYERSYKYIL